MRHVLRDTALEANFQREGYITVPFLDETAVNKLTDAYFRTLVNSGGLHRSDQITYDFTFIDRNIDYKRQVFDLIAGAFREGVDQYLLEYKSIIANFIRKQNQGGEVPLHQNWAFVDERRYTSVSIWCPLVDSNEENGTLQVVPGSHKRFGEHRGPMVPWELEPIKEEIVANCLTPMNIKAGEAVILDDSIVHYSDINRTEGLRLAIQLILIPEEAESIHYYMDRESRKGHIDVLETDRDFYMEFNPWKQAGDARRLRTIRYRPEKVTFGDFKRRLYGPRIDEGRPGRLNLFGRFKRNLAT